MRGNCWRIHFPDTFHQKLTFRVAMADDLFTVCEPRADVLQGVLKLVFTASYAEDHGIDQRLTRLVSPVAHVLATVADKS